MSLPVHTQWCCCRTCKHERRVRRYESGDRRFWEDGLSRDGSFRLTEPRAGVVE